ncbi:porin [Paraburkholderia tropica]|uniref:porin n=1 Tax=Paraburkholderia tropica TaxID=92647 RepID=UPI002AB0B77B|nr:porin [Paraburkholderia tropica]
MKYDHSHIASYVPDMPCRRFGLLWASAITALCISTLTSSAHAQSSVTVFGLLDEGVTYASNVDGKRYIGTQTGIQAPNLFGVRGTEDLGGGYAAIFLMDGFFSIDTGAMSGGGPFGRESYIGLSSPWGTITMGKQFDYMYDSLSIARWGQQIPYVSLYQLPDGPYANMNAPLGTFDYSRTAGGAATPNTVKFTSAPYHGLHFGAMYGFSNVAGQFGNGNLSSFGLDYASGPLRMDAAYTYSKQDGIDSNEAGIRNFGFGGRYDFGRLALDALYTNTHNTFNGAQIDSFEVGGLYPVSPFFFIYAQYIYSKGNEALTNNQAHQAGVTFDYLLSKRTDVYLNVIYQHAKGGEQVFAAISGSPGTSSSPNQTVIRVAMRHLF